MTQIIASVGPTAPSAASVVDAGDLTKRQLWDMEINASIKAKEQFVKRAEIANQRYLDERDALLADQKFFNVFYANTNIMASALYSTSPEPSVCRRNDDYMDDVARVGALILQRALQQDINDPEDTLDEVITQAIQDRLIAGMGTAWLRLETEVEDVPTSEGGTLTNDAQGTQPHAQHPYDGFTMQPLYDAPDQEVPVPLKRIKEQRVAVDYVHWQDFFFSPCRLWSERRWVGRKVYMTRKQLTKRFGKDKADNCALDYSTVSRQIQEATSTQGYGGAEHDVFNKATVYEIWDRVNRKVVWFAPGYPTDLLDEKDDFLELQSFEPCPTPMFANLTTGACMPRPDYYMLQDQYSELNSVNARISLLVSACKVAGVYDEGSDAVKGLLQGNENTLIPVQNWGQFSEKGGMKGAIDWLPLDQIVVGLQRLYEAREAIKGQIYELSGIADIVRGASKASETLGAQKIKAQFASIRIQKLQGETSNFVSEILRIKAEIMVKHFTPELLIRRSNIAYTPNHEWVPQALLLLKSEAGFKWRVEIKSDSMHQADYAQEKQERIEFLSAMSGYLSQALPMAMQLPELKPVILGSFKWAIQSFRGAADIVGMIDKQISMLEGKPPPPPKQDPKVQALQMKAQIDQQKAQQDGQAKQQEMQLKAQEGQMKLQMQREEMVMQQQEHEQEMAFRREEMAMEQQAQQVDLQTTMQKAQLDMQTHQQVAQQKVQDGMIQSDLNRQKMEGELEMSRAQGEQEMALGQQRADQELSIGRQKGQQDLELGKQKGAQVLKLSAARAKQQNAQRKPAGGLARSRSR